DVCCVAWRRVRASAVPDLKARCLSYGSSTPYLPILDLVRAYGGIQDSDDPATVVQRVRSALLAVGLEPDEHGPSIARLLGVADATGSVESARTSEDVRAL